MPLNITGRNLYFKSGIDNKQLKKDAKAGSREIDKMTGKVKKSGDSMAASLKKAFKFIIGAVIVKKIFDISKALFKAGSDAEEIRSKFEVTFQTINEEADKVAKSLSRGYGLARVKAEELLSTTGDLLTGFGFTRQEALDTSDAVQKLSVDLASFNNLQGGTAQASHIITKALLGERETLTTLGVKIMDMDLQQELLNRGMSKLTGTALLQAKALITLDMIAIQSKNAIGDFARTSQSAANQGRILKENIKDLSVNFGKKLTPSLANAEIEANKLVRSLVEMTEIKMSDTFKTERVALNRLVLQITSANTSQENRVKLIDELQKKYPFFLENMSKEELTNENIAKRLGEVNQAYIDKITLQTLNEKIEKEGRKKSAKDLDAGNAEIELLNKISEAGAKLSITQELIGKGYYEQIGIIKKANEARASKLKVMWFESTTLSKLNIAYNKYLNTGVSVVKQENEVNEAIERKNELLAILKKTEEEILALVKAIKDEEPETPVEKKEAIPELTRIEAITELNGLLKKQTELEQEIGKQQLKNASKLKPFVATVTNLYNDLGKSTLREGKQRLKMIDAMIKEELKYGRTVEKLLDERSIVIQAMVEEINKVREAMYILEQVMGDFDSNIGRLIGSTTELLTSLTMKDASGIFGGIVGVMKTLYDYGNQLIREQDEAVNEERRKSNEELNNVLGAVNRSLQMQLKLLAEINGTPWLVGAVGQVRNIEKEMEVLLKQLQEIEVRRTTRGHALIDTSEWDIDKWQVILDKFYAPYGGGVAFGGFEDNVQAIIDAYREQEDALAGLMDSYMQELTGTTTENIADSIAQGFSEGLDSAEVFADTFEDLMRNALIEALKRSLYDKGLEQFYENFYKAVESGGGLDQDEIDRLREEYNQILANAEAAWASMSELLGDEFALPGEEDPLVGAIRGLSEETAGVLAGQMMAIRINVAEGLEVAENSFLQLVEIADNTSYNHYLEQITAILQQNSEQALLRSGG